MIRRSERELEHALDDLDGGGDLPSAGLIRVMSGLTNDGHEFEVVDGHPDRRIVRIDGDLYRLTERVAEVIRG